MQNTEKPCRHEYVKIFQRKYKGLGRRLGSTRGYLPVGFTAKDFAHLSEGSFCFCTTCRVRLYPTKGDRITRNLVTPALKVVAVQSDESPSGQAEMTDNLDNELQVVDVDELQVESIEVDDIADKRVIVEEDGDSEEEQGEE